MRPQFLSIFIVVAITVLSCKKSSTSAPPNPPPPPPPTEQDTLAANWTKKVITGSPSFFDIFFINNTGFALAATGIYKSTDGGDNWNEIVSGVVGGSYNINMGMGTEKNVSFAVGPSSLVSSHDGGSTFETVTVADPSISDVFYVDSISAYAAGKGIWKTTDGGSHWTKLHDFSTTSTYQTLYFLDDQNGWVIRTDGLYKTINGGVDWQPVSTGSQFNFQFSGVVFFVNANHGFIADTSSVGVTTNGGTGWNKIYTGSNKYHDLFFLDDNIGYMTDDRYILKTIDGGTTWTKEASIPGTLFIELHFTNANHGWACGSGGTILRFQQP